MPTLSDIDLGHAITLAPRDAIAYFEQKGYQIPPDWRWWETDAATHAQAFTIAKGARADVLTAVRTALRQAFGGADAMPDGRGISQAEFVRRLTPELHRLGWWGQQIVVAPDGGAEVVQLGSPWRLKHLYRANVQAAYNAGRYKQQLENADARPWWMRIEIMDDNTRPSHRGLHGAVYRYDDPFWQHFYPPDDHGCRGRVRTLSDRQLEREGIKAQTSEGKMGTAEVEVGTDPRTGEVVTRQVTTMRFTGTDGQDYVHVPAWGWDGNIGARVFGTDVAIMQKLSLLEDQAVLTQAVQSLNNSALRQAQFAGWIDGAIAGREHATQTLTLMAEAVADFARAHGAEPARVLTLDATDVVSAASIKHADAGIALSVDELKTLPAALADPAVQVVWDTTRRCMLYAVPQADGSAWVVVVESQKRIDQVVAAYKIPEGTILADRARFVPMTHRGT